MKLNRSIVRKLIIESLSEVDQMVGPEGGSGSEAKPSKPLTMKQKIMKFQELIDLPNATGNWKKDGTDQHWEDWLAVKQSEAGEMLGGINIEKAGADWANNSGTYKPNIDGIIEFAEDLDAKAHNTVQKKLKKQEEQEKEQQEKKAKQAKLARANKLKGWDSSSPPGGSAGNLDITDYKITSKAYGQSKNAKKLDVGFDDILKVSLMPRPAATKAKIYISMAPQGEDSAYYTFFWKTKKLDFQNLGVYLGEVDGGFELTIPQGILKLSQLIETSMKDKVIYKSGSRSLSGADVAWLAIKLYGNDEKISNGFKKYAAESAGGGDSRKVGAKDVKKESKRLDSNLLRRLILKTLKENGEL